MPFASGDLIDIALEELHPTQAVLGYDEVYYKLGRYRANKDVVAGGVNRKFEDWCEANGEGTAASVSAGARLDDRSSFTCTTRLGAETEESLAPMKTVVIGPRGEVFLTDGHHTLTSFWETADGGPGMHVRVRVLGNLSTLSTEEFWWEMQARGWSWLYDERDQPIAPHQLPQRLGLREFRHDPYRGMIYFARDVGYEQLPENAAFQEFYWARWIRRSADPALSLSACDLNDLTSYLALVQATAHAMTALGDDDVVSDGRSARQIGKMPSFDASVFAKLSNPFADPKPGKVAYALEYRSKLPTPLTATPSRSRPTSRPQ